MNDERPTDEMRSEPTTPDGQAGSERQTTENADTERRTGSEPPASFSSLVLTLALSALQQLNPGQPDKDGKPVPPAPELAKPVIDTLEVLKEKTRGNLTDEETDLLDSVLLDLRLRYLKCTGAANSGQAKE